MFASTLKVLGPRMRSIATKPVIENYAFKLHYQFTVILLVLFIIIVCAKEYFGDYIQCIADQGVGDDKYINSYCFVMSTFTIARLNNETEMAKEKLGYPGVGTPQINDEYIHHTYYQWVPFVLIIQSICFYMPHYIWKQKEGGRMRLLVDGLKNASVVHDVELKCKTGVIPSKQSVAKKLETIKVDILLRLRTMRAWSTWLVGMEIINFVHIVLEIFITDLFLGGSFISLGPRVISFDNWSGRISPFDIVFPKVTKCIINKFGPSGTLQEYDVLCVMKLNVAYEKIYFILWFWFFGLLIVSLLAVIWRIATSFLYCFFPRFSVLMFWRANASNLHPEQVAQVVNGCGFGDWLFLYYLAKNMPQILFEALFRSIAKEMEKLELPAYNTCQKKDAEPDRIDYNDEMYSRKNGQKSQ